MALVTGLGQVAFTSAFGFLIALALGFDWVTSVYVGIALTFSSTIIIVKLLSDKREIDSLHGRIALGFLIVQDLVVVAAMIVLSAIGQGAEAADGEGGLIDVMMVFVYGAALVGLVGLFIRFVATPLVTRMAAAPELLIAFAIGWAALLAAVGHYLGFGKELGGLLAGCRWPRHRSARRSRRGWRRCGTSCCCSSSSRWGPRWTLPSSATVWGQRLCFRCSC